MKGDEECKRIREDAPAELIDYVGVRVRGVRVLDRFFINA